MILLYLFLHTNFKSTTFRESLGRFDFIGSILVLASSVAIVYALTYGGSRFAWSNWHIVVPLVIGLVTLVVFHAYEASPWVKEHYSLHIFLPIGPRQSHSMRPSFKP
jgi:cadmium resistance protein CadD (predicted permease)